MRVRFSAPRLPLRSLLVGVFVVVLALVSPGLAPAGAVDARLQRAEQERQAVAEKLSGLLARLDKLEAETAVVEARLTELERAQHAQQAQAEQASDALAARVQASYKRGTADPLLTLMTTGSPQQAGAQARLLNLLALRHRADYERATASRVRTRVTAEEVARTAATLEARRSELEATRQQVAATLARAEAQVEDVRSRIAAEQAAREREARLARERAAREARERQIAARTRRPAAASRGRPASVPADPAPVVGDVACPVGRPRSYSDTYGAPRSGGRRHKGTDILAPRGTPIYAYESGVVTRTSTSRVGGISLYMRGDSGTLYYYTHLQGYVDGIGPGSRVSVGAHIAANGDTGNARGVPHLHFEVMPGGGGNVNPYPYVRRACG